MTKKITGAPREANVPAKNTEPCIRCGENPRAPGRRICAECIKADARANSKIYYHKHLEQQRERVKRKYHVANPDARYKISAEEYKDLKTMLEYPGDDADSGRNRKMTNGDKIRQMSDEELAKLLSVGVKECDGCVVPGGCWVDGIPTCEGRICAWLKKEAKDAD